MEERNKVQSSAVKRGGVDGLQVERVVGAKVVVLYLEHGLAGGRGELRLANSRHIIRSSSNASRSSKLGIGEACEALAEDLDMCSNPVLAIIVQPFPALTPP